MLLFSRIALIAAIAFAMTACYQAQLRGSIAGADVTLTPLNQPDNLLAQETSWDDAILAALFGQEKWDTTNPFSKHLFTGIFTLPTEGLDSSQNYLITSQGGVDTDPDGNGLIDTPGLPVLSPIRAIVPGNYIGEANGHTSVLTEAVYQYVEDQLEGIDSESLAAWLDDIAAGLVDDMNNDGEVNYLDVLNWSEALSYPSFQGDPGLLDAFADSVAAGETGEQLSLLGNEVVVSALERPTGTIYRFGDGDGDVAAMISLDSGNHFTLLNNAGSLGAVGVSLVDGSTGSIILDANGNATELKLGDFTYSFSNYTDTTVDVTATDINGASATMTVNVDESDTAAFGAPRRTVWRTGARDAVEPQFDGAEEIQEIVDAGAYFAYTLGERVTPLCAISDVFTETTCGEKLDALRKAGEEADYVSDEARGQDDAFDEESDFYTDTGIDVSCNASWTQSECAEGSSGVAPLLDAALDKLEETYDNIKDKLDTLEEGKNQFKDFVEDIVDDLEIDDNSEGDGGYEVTPYEDNTPDLDLDELNPPEDSEAFVGRAGTYEYSGKGRFGGEMRFQGMANVTDPDTGELIAVPRACSYRIWADMEVSVTLTIDNAGYGTGGFGIQDVSPLSHTALNGCGPIGDDAFGYFAEFQFTNSTFLSEDLFPGDYTTLQEAFGRISSDLGYIRLGWYARVTRPANNHYQEQRADFTVYLQSRRP